VPPNRSATRTPSPEAVQAIITQNGNAYEMDWGVWAPLQSWWKSGSDEEREGVRAGFLPSRTTKWHTSGNRKLTVAPRHIILDFTLLERPGNQISIGPYFTTPTNVKLLSAVHEYFRKSQGSCLAAWGKQWPYFHPGGSGGFPRGIPRRKSIFWMRDIFAVETNTSEIGRVDTEVFGKEWDLRGRKFRIFRKPIFATIPFSISQNAAQYLASSKIIIHNISLLNNLVTMNCTQRCALRLTFAFKPRDTIFGAMSRRNVGLKTSFSTTLLHPVDRVQARGIASVTTRALLHDFCFFVAARARSTVGPWVAKPKGAWNQTRTTKSSASCDEYTSSGSH